MVTSIVENPISVGQAFWAPYKKVGRWISEKMEKIASEKNEAVHDKMTTKVEDVSAVNVEGGAKEADKVAAKSSFDIAQFAGIFAAIGMALGFLGQFVVALFKGIASISVWKLLGIIVLIILVISLPSMFLAWRKLRRRDLGPVLNANGWAINATALVSVPFGKSLTQVALFPKLASVDPAFRRKRSWRRVGWIALIAAIVAVGYLFFTDRLAPYGMPYHEEEPVEEVIEEEMTEETIQEESAPELSLEEPAAEAE